MRQKVVIETTDKDEPVVDVNYTITEQRIPGLRTVNSPKLMAPTLLKKKKEAGAKPEATP